jgi:hypothetical protein
MNSRRLIGSLSPRVTPYHIVVAMPSCASQQNWRGNGSKKRIHLFGAYVCFDQLRILRFETACASSMLTCVSSRADACAV